MCRGSECYQGSLIKKCIFFLAKQNEDMKGIMFSIFISKTNEAS